jgi:hypothetical protein
VVLVGLNEVKVGSFTLRESILTVELEFGSDDGVLTPAMQGEGGLCENKGAGIRDTGVHVSMRSERTLISCGIMIVTGGSIHFIHWVAVRRCSPPLLAIIGSRITGTSIIEETRCINVLINGFRAAECVDGVRKGVNGVGVVEGLGAEQTVQELIAVEGRTVVNVLIWLDDPDEFLNGVVKVELDLVGRRTNGLITGELQLFNEVLVGVLGHAPALVGVQEDVVDVQRCGDEGLIVCGSNAAATTDGAVGVVQRTDGPQALIDGTDIEIDLDFVVLKGDQGQSKTGIAAVPELEGNIEGGFREGVAGSANLARSAALTRTVNIIE